MPEASPSLPRIKDVIDALETWAPPGPAQSYDNVGLQIGDPSREVRCALVALDVTPAVLEEAKQLGATLLITHHPLLFRPLSHLTTGGWTNSLALRLAEAGIALYSSHTNLDAAPQGVSFSLAAQLGLEQPRVLSPLAESLYKLAVFVPTAFAEQVRAALAAAGAGRIGNYRDCAFATPGTGYFRPGEAAAPFTGVPGGPLEEAQELKVEVEVSRWTLPPVVAALKAAHPYEEVAYDVYPVLQPHSRYGLGVVGRLDAPEPLTAFLHRVAERLNVAALRYVGDAASEIATVAVCGGAGSDLAKAALQAGADAFVTADVTYHKFFDVLGADGTPRMALIDAGHYETEAGTEKLLEQWLSDRFPAVRWHRTRTRTSPIHTFCHSR